MYSNTSAEVDYDDLRYKDQLRQVGASLRAQQRRGGGQADRNTNPSIVAEQVVLQDTDAEAPFVMVGLSQVVPISNMTATDPNDTVDTNVQNERERHQLVGERLEHLLAILQQQGRGLSVVSREEGQTTNCSKRQQHTYKSNWFIIVGALVLAFLMGGGVASLVLLKRVGLNYGGTAGMYGMTCTLMFSARLRLFFYTGSYQLHGVPSQHHNCHR